MALAALLAASCAKESSQKETSLPNAAISVEASVSGLTKAVTEGTQTSFVADDQLTLYAWTGSNTAVPDKKVVNGVVNTYDGTTWTPASTMLWKNVSDAHYFLGISPARAVKSFTADLVSSSEDLLVATVLGDGIVAPQTVTAPPVQLTFSHVMAVLKVNVKYRNQWGGVPEAVVKAVAAPAGTIDFLTKAITPGTVSTQTLSSFTAATGYDATYSSLCIPQAFRTIEFVIAGQTLVYTHNEDITLEAGKVSTISLLVGKDKIALENNTVSAWEAGEVNPDMGAASGLLVDATRPLTIKAKENGTTVTFTDRSSGDVTWITSDGRSGIINLINNKVTLAAGQRVWFIGDGTNNAFGTGAESTSSRIALNKDCEVYGNIMSLLGPDFATNTTLPSNNTFAYLFSGQTHLKNNAEEGLILPATTLIQGCYRGLFKGCTGLSQVVVNATAGFDATNCFLDWVKDIPGAGFSVVTPDPKQWTMGDNLPWGATVYTPGENGPEAVYTAPTTFANPLIYNTAAQTLISAGTAHKDGIVFEYSTDCNTWSTTVPQGTDAGDYSVYSRVKDGGVTSEALATAIEPKTVTNPTITLATTSYTYDGTAKKPAVSSVKDGNNTIASSEYTVSYSNNTNAKAATATNAPTVTITDKTGGNYTVSGSKTFTINKAAGSISYATTVVNKAYGNAAFTNALNKVGDGTVTYSSNATGIASVNTSSGQVSVGNPGTATVTATVTDGNNYTYATKTATYTVKVSYTKDFAYNGSVQTWKAPSTGSYDLEVWGAEGGGRVSDSGGKGGYAKGRITVTAGTTIYIVVGGKGGSVSAWQGVPGPVSGGYNGGGDGGKGVEGYSGSGGGGGATHMAYSSFVISKSGTQSYAGTNYIIVAGGGGGRGHGVTTAGNGGGTSGGIGNRAKSGGSQSYTDYYYYDTNCSYGRDGYMGLKGDTSAEGSGGGGAGYCGGTTYLINPLWSDKNFRSASGCGGSSNYNSSYLSNFTTTAGQQSGNGKAKITFVQ